MARKNIKVIAETDTGANKRFSDPSKKIEMTRAQFVKKIEAGDYPGYHVANVNNIKTPKSNPDKSNKNNNLG